MTTDSPPPVAFSVPEVVVTGVGVATRVGEHAARLNATHALVVTDPGVAELGIADDAARHLADAGVACVTFAGVTPDPTVENVRDGLDLYRRHGCDLIVAVGGGSSIDCGKGIAVSLTNEGRLPEYMGVDKIPNPGAPLIAIPTTGGTGSEVTKVTVITDADANVKVMMSSPNLLARVALVDPLLSITTPPKLTAAVGVDALTHAIEAYVSRRANPITDGLALQAIRMISGSLRRAWQDGADLSARTEVMLGACIAGMAFSNSSVALVHGMSRPIGAVFHVHHGLSNAVLLLDVMRFSLPGAPERFADVAAAMGEGVDGVSATAGADQAVEAVARLLADVEMPRLGAIGIDRDAFEDAVTGMAEDAVASGSPANNPRHASAEDIVSLYRACW
ncbi:MAG: iron-containing alcohol dehydrogenase [Candidatus Poribacteria bacterium]